MIVFICTVCDWGIKTVADEALLKKDFWESNWQITGTQKQKQPWIAVEAIL